MASRRLVAIAALLGPMGAVGGCSLVNSFDDVKPLTSGDDDAGTADVSTVDHASPGDAGTDATAADGSSDSSLIDAPILDGALDEDAAPLPPSGAIVEVASITPDSGPKAYFLTVLDPKTGVEIAKREAMNVAGLRYDGLRDVWYIFENKGTGSSPLPTDEVDLHVRTLDTHTGVWTELQKLPVPPLVANADIAPLRDRLAYIAYTVSDSGAPGYELAVLDTSTASSVSVASALPLLFPPVGMTGTRSPSGAGGSVNLVYLDTSSCQGDGGASDVCAVNAVHVNVQPSSAPVVVSPTRPLGAAQRFGGSAAGGSWLGGGPDDIFAFPPTLGNSGYIEHFSPLAVSLGQKVNFPVTGPFLVGLAVAECWNMALVTELKTDQEIFGIPFSGGTVLAKGTGHANQGIAFEPYTSTALVPFGTGGGRELSAFALTGTPAAPVLSKRSAGWSPPIDLEPIAVATKQPIPFACP